MKTTNKQTGNRQKPSEQVTQAGLQLLPLIMNNIPQAVFWKDRDLVYLGCNQAFAEDAGLSSPEEIVGKTDFDMPWKDQAELYRADDSLVMENGEPKLNYEEPQTTPDGSTIWLNTSKIPVHENGQVVAVLGMYEDITERKQTEALMLSMVESAPEAIGIVDLTTGLFREPNENAVKLYGLSREELVKVGPADMSPPVQPDGRLSTEKAMEKINLAMQGESPVFEWMHRNGRGEDIPCEVRLVRLPGDLPRVRFSVTDITTRRQAEETIQESQARFQGLVETLSDWIWEVDQNGVYTYTSPKVKDLLGYEPEEVLGKTPFDLMPSEEAQRVAGVFGPLLSTQQPLVGLENTNRHKDGHLVVLETSGVPFFDAHGNFIGYRGTDRDITQRKQAEKALRDSQQFLQIVMDNIPQSIFWKDRNLTYLGCNRAFAADAGLASPSDVIDKTDWDMPWKEQAELYRADDSLVMENGAPKLNYEEPQTTPDGSVIWLRTGKVPLHDVDGNVTGVLGMYEDITERKQVEETVQESRARFQGLVETLNDWIWEVDQNGTYTYVSPKVEDLLGYEPEEILGKTPFDLMPPEEAQRVAGVFGPLLSTQQPLVALENTNRHKDGHLVVFETSGVPFFDAQGEFKGYRGTDREITERKKLEQQIQTAFERRGRQVRLSNQVSQSIAAASSLEEVYQRVVTQVKEQFGYYHTQILRYEAAQEAVVLVTGYGEIGEKMLAAGHRMPMGEGLIGTAAATGETVLRSSLENDPDWHPNPLLPETKGEIAVPIKLGDTILGVLDVQSNVVEALDADAQLLLEGLCGQIATVIESIRLREEMAERLEEINRLYRAMSHEGWQVYRQTEDIPAGFIYNQMGIVPVQATEFAKELFISQPIAVPGGVTIGKLSIADDPQHPLSSEDISMVHQISEQIALALESARLFDQTQSALAQSEKLFDASRRLTQAIDLQELVAATVTTLDIPVVNRAVLTTFDYDAAGDIEQLTVIANWWNGEGHEVTPVGTRYPLEVIRVMPMFVSPTPVFFNDTFKDERVDAITMELVKRQNLRAVGVLPLHVGSQQIGALILESEDPHDFTQDQIRLFTALAPQVATVLENRQQYEKAQRQAEREAMLNAINQKIQSATSVEAVLQIAARELGHALGAPMTIAQLSMKDQN